MRSRIKHYGPIFDRVRSDLGNSCNELEKRIRTAPEDVARSAAAELDFLSKNKLGRNISYSEERFLDTIKLFASGGGTKTLKSQGSTVVGKVPKHVGVCINSGASSMSHFDYGFTRQPFVRGAFQRQRPVQQG